MAKGRDVNDKSREILSLLADGLSDQEILDGHAAISRQDIAVAARQALAALEQVSERTYSVEAIRQRYPRAYERWTNDEESRLIQLYRDGNSTAAIAAALERQPGGVRSRMDRIFGGPAKLAPQPTSTDDQTSRVEEPPPEAYEGHYSPPSDPGSTAPAVSCRQCGQAIPPARLDAAPGTTLCVSCQERAEHPEPNPEDDELCPRCDSKLVWKQPRDPESTRYFLACSAYPDCRYIDPTTGHSFGRRR